MLDTNGLKSHSFLGEIFYESIHGRHNAARISF